MVLKPKPPLVFGKTNPDKWWCALFRFIATFRILW